MDAIKIAMVGLDTSHCEAFTKLLSQESNPHFVPGGKIVAAYPGGSDLCAVSRDRVGRFTAVFRDELGVPIFDCLEDLGPEADAFMLESADGRQHLEQFRVLARFGKPVFVDKPLACSLADARQIADIARHEGVSLMSSSSLRFARGISGLVPPQAQVRTCEVFGPAKLLDDYPAYFWYAVHGADVLFSYMGTGCGTVQVAHTDDIDLLLGTWQDGRLGSLRGTRTAQNAFGCTVFTDREVVQSIAVGEPPYYTFLLKEVIEFFRTGRSPIDIYETVEIMGFLEAAGRSLESGGKAVPVGG